MNHLDRILQCDIFNVEILILRIFLGGIERLLILTLGWTPCLSNTISYHRVKHIWLNWHWHTHGLHSADVKKWAYQSLTKTLTRRQMEEPPHISDEETQKFWLALYVQKKHLHYTFNEKLNMQIYFCTVCEYVSGLFFFSCGCSLNTLRK